jgi:hypothetical protein
MCHLEMKHLVHYLARGKEHCCCVCQMKTVARSVTAICVLGLASRSDTSDAVVTVTDCLSVLALTVSSVWHGLHNETEIFPPVQCSLV